MVIVLVFFVVMVVLDILVSRFGHDSRLELWSDELGRATPR